MKLEANESIAGVSKKTHCISISYSKLWKYPENTIIKMSPKNINKVIPENNLTHFPQT